LANGKKDVGRKEQVWAEFRFSVVGGLLASPPQNRGELTGQLKALSDKTWQHPLTKEAFKFSWSTVERWYYLAKSSDSSPVKALKKKERSDQGAGRTLSEEFKAAILSQYRQYPWWTYQLHHENAKVLSVNNSDLGAAPSYMTILRYFKENGFHRTRRPNSDRETAGQALARTKLETREIRSFEVEYGGGLWHLDFHHSSLKVLDETGSWIKPLALCITDDHTRLCCHVQWYTTESTRDLVHGFCQALQKRGLPRALMTDNGSAMTSDEFTSGLSRLGISHDKSLPYSPYQNGKVEKFWANLEGRLMSMLEGQDSLTFKTLNDVTQAWVEMDYNRGFHKEIQSSPVDRHSKCQTVYRDCPSGEDLRQAFRTQVKRRVRRSDGTITIDGIRFEIPAPYNGLQMVTVHYARWNMAHVHLVDERSLEAIARILPIDKTINSEGLRRSLEPRHSLAPEKINGLPPLLEKYLSDFAATGLPMPYLVPVEGELLCVTKLFEGLMITLIAGDAV
jgi:transposase InsO family protein